MLHIQHISKVYRTGSLTQRALSDVSLSLRDNEFVAILGPSGSGKTTLLNIIGGLDRYDEGDLIINGISTKRYSDRDWDSYRNHTVGFVFQSYNLIPHQTVLKNVELALTISGVSSKERTKRAKDALVRVGLGEHIHKKPSQLSGGQMQRVAIARALVNDPDILLADEPTGALDSQTSIQVMELLKEVANDRLVVMVTHNPELAEQYATRVVELRDGEITGDSNPAQQEDQTDAVHKNMGKSSMSFFTSLFLSFNNLWTKKARTILVAFAGSIGIIGIALILSMSTGANQYIKNVEEESLQSYPLQISDTSFNLASLYTVTVDNAEPEDTEGKVQEMLTVTSLFSKVTTNDLKSFKAFLESGESDIYDHVQAIEYSYGISPYIYSVKEDGSFRKVNPDSTFSALGFSGSNSGSNSLLSLVSSTDTFYSLPESKRLYENGYDLMAGRYPEDYNECLVVLTTSGRITDMTLYTLGLKDPAELDQMINDFAEGESSDVDDTPSWYDYDDIVGVEFSVIPAYELYAYDSEMKIWADHSSDKTYVKRLLSDAEKLEVVGVIRPSEDNDSPTLQMGIAYSADLTGHLGALAADSEAVKAQLDSPDVNIFTNKPFGDESQMQMDSFFTVDEKALADAFNIDASALDFSNIDLSGINFSNIDLSSIDTSAFADAFSSVSAEDIENMFDGVNIEISADKMQALFEGLLEGYLDYAKSDPETDYTKLPDAIRSYLISSEMREILLTDLERMFKENADKVFTEEQLAALIEQALAEYPNWLSDNHLTDTESYEHLNEYFASDVGKKQLDAATEALKNKLMELLLTDEQLTELAYDLLDGYNSYAHKNSLPSGTALLSSFTEYLGTEDAKNRITDGISEIIDEKELAKLFENYGNLMGEQIAALAGAVMEQMITQISGALTSSMSQLSGSLGDSLQNMFKLDPEALGKMFQMNMSTEDLEALMGSLLSGDQNSYESNLRKLGYCNFDNPSMVTIYPNDFDSKKHVKDIIADYNRRMEESGEDDKVIQYTDMVDTLMGSVSTIINVISWVLIAFVAISLVVSSIMIGVITYISVLERKKEIGILRAIGASRRNISEVFNAETVIIGLLAGLIGVGITYVLLIPGNALLHAVSGQPDINAVFPPLAAVILVGLSIVLTMIGGLIPAAKAAHQDPVEALRSE